MIILSNFFIDKNRKIRVKFYENGYDWVEINTKDAIFMISCTLNVAAEFILGEIHTATAYMVGDITIEGYIRKGLISYRKLLI